ncbi:pimeloyl-[acyl-carrier protein] methyl ester esterase [Aliivibrio sp. 1S165]|uniref:pimeloyl-ACP methyl ester esterase BioH n=1 Tax=unclassified Aliivibrio TaxID=2645654 RepID=UPI00080D9753|nr:MULTISPECIES: pimeloyl-ACP methyl ester esterase BioH [unclassified Aliivibrio]OCH11979.1 pimeloyl-[acyl-carrier protein] methyl ester esterase [Aliivibrio sp. 1S165]OCH35905.1 pimeloyl-[acyl-carrier protein] methyl ester esterase [Aliivibrio sp. 1S175]
MTTSLYWQTEGEGSDLVLIHGWGMNGAVWMPIVAQLRSKYKVHTVDLSGYGYSADLGSADFDKMVEQVLDQAPEKAAWLGWSLGGLIATQAALVSPERVSQLITVASSPCFSAEKGWRGIKPAVLSLFTEQLKDDFKLTVERFMALQAMGSPNAKQDIKQVKQAVFSRPAPNQAALATGLTILADIDLREHLSQLTMPVCRMYGRLDGLVPVKVAHDMDELIPHSVKVVFDQASHAPFISHSDEFIMELHRFLAR